MAAHNKEYAASLCRQLNLGPEDLVVEIASNDGSLLRCFQAHGVRTLGVEPARNIAAAASASGVETINEFFTPAVAIDVRTSRRPARVVAANNVLAHVDDPAAFLRGCRELVADDGLITIEMPYVGELLDRFEYDTVYHEHLSYFSVRSLLALADRVELAAVRIDRVPVHGGSLRLYLSRSAPQHAPEVMDLAEQESAAGVTSAERYREFARQVRESRTSLVSLLERLVADGRTLAGYGAPAKGNTLLNYCGIDTRLLPYTVDKNPLKVGLLTPGTHIPVRDVAALSVPGTRPDYVLILAWNFAEEIIEQQHAYRASGGQFIVPIPTAHVVTA
jgi:hypothetical protein